MKVGITSRNHLMVTTLSIAHAIPLPFICLFFLPVLRKHLTLHGTHSGKLVSVLLRMQALV